MEISQNVLLIMQIQEQSGSLQGKYEKEQLANEKLERELVATRETSSETEAKVFHSSTQPIFCNFLILASLSLQLVPADLNNLNATMSDVKSHYKRCKIIFNMIAGRCKTVAVLDQSLYRVENESLSSRRAVVVWYPSTES